MKKIADTDINSMVALRLEGYSLIAIGKMLEPKRSARFVYDRTKFIKVCESRAQVEAKIRHKRLSKLAETMAYKDVAALEGVSEATVAVAVTRFPHDKPRSYMRSKNRVNQPKCVEKIKPIKLDDDLAEKVKAWRLKGMDASDTANTLRLLGMSAKTSSVQAYYDTMPPLKIGFMGMPIYA